MNESPPPLFLLVDSIYVPRPRSLLQTPGDGALAQESLVVGDILKNKERHGSSDKPAAFTDHSTMFLIPKRSRLHVNNAILKWMLKSSMFITRQVELHISQLFTFWCQQIFIISIFIIYPSINVKDPKYIDNTPLLLLVWLQYKLFSLFKSQQSCNWKTDSASILCKVRWRCCQMGYTLLKDTQGMWQQASMTFRRETNSLA